MDVQLPNGQVITDVPEGTTRSALAAKLGANGFAVPGEWMQDAPAPVTAPSAQHDATTDVLTRGVDTSRDAEGKRGLGADLLSSIDSAGNRVGAAMERIGNSIFGSTPEQDAHAANLARVAEDQAPTTLPGNVASGLVMAPMGPGSAAGLTALSEGNERYQQDVDTGVDQRTALEDAALHGGISGGAQLLPMGRLVTSAGGKALARSAVGATIRSAGVGAGQAAADDLSSQALLDDAGYSSLGDARGANVVNDAESGAAFMAGMHMGAQALHAGAGRLAAKPETTLPETPPGYVPPTADASVVDQLKAVRDVSAPPAPVAEDPIARGIKDAGEQKQGAIGALDSAQTVDQMIDAANDLATRPHDDIVARADQTAVETQAAAFADAAQAHEDAATTKLQEAIEAEAKLQQPGAEEPEAGPDRLAARGDSAPESTQVDDAARGEHAQAQANLRSALGYAPEVARERMQQVEQQAAEDFGGPVAVARDPAGYTRTVTDRLNAEARATLQRGAAPAAQETGTLARSTNRELATAANDNRARWSTSESGAVPPEEQMPTEALQALAQNATSRLPSAPEVRVLDSAASLPAEVERPPAGTVASGTVHDGTVYLFRDGIGSPDEALKTVFHELFHYGLRKVLPREQYTDTMIRLAQDSPVVAKAASAWRESPEGQARRSDPAFGTPADYYAHSVEEGLAVISEQLHTADGGQGSAPRPAIVRQVVGALSRVAERLGMSRLAGIIRGLNMTQAERFITNAVGRAGTGAPDAPGWRGNGAARFSTKPPGEGVDRPAGDEENRPHDDTATPEGVAPAGKPNQRPLGGEAGAGADERPGAAGAARPGAGSATAADAARAAASRAQGLSPQAQAGAGAPAPRAASHAARIGARAMDTMRAFGDKTGLGDALREVQEAVMPMSAPGSSDRARAAAKDYANADRLAQWQWQKFVDILSKGYAPDRLEAMWNAADEENLIRGGHEPAQPGKGLAALSSDERATVELLSQYGNELLQRARDVGMFDGEALPYWTPRMAVMIGEDGSYYRPPKSGTVGVDITTNAPSLKGRKYLRAEETEAAQKAALGDNAELVRDIRAMPLAMARLERAVAGRELVERVRQATLAAGVDGVRDGPADGYFTLDHPAFKVYSPQYTTNPRTGAVEAVVDQHGQPVFQQRALYILNEFRGPLKSIVYDPPGKTYASLMALKRTSTGLIMYSPLIHNQVIFGKALSAVGFNPAKLVSLYVKGNRLRTGADSSTMREAITNGMAPIGNFGAKQDITSIASDPQLAAGKGPISKAVGGAVGLVSKDAGQGVKRGIDAASHFWHNTLLWDRIADLQVGLYAHAKEKLVAQYTKAGLPPDAAAKAAGLQAAHLANRYAGALPNEAMSGSMRKFANLVMFSRSFTLGNMGLFKDAVKGLPADARSQLTLQYGQAIADKVNGAARRKAQGMLLLEVGGMYVLNSLLQDGVKAWLHTDDDHSFLANMGDQLAAYGPRAKAAVAHAIADPGDVLPFVGHPFKFIHSFTSNGANEPGLENRVRGANMSNGTATYYRAPVGKVGEDLEGWLSQPLQMVWQKSGTLLKPAIDIGMQAAGHPADGKNLWAPSDSTLTAMGKAAAHFFEGQLPVTDAQTAYDLLKGSSNAALTPQQQEHESMQKRKLALPILTGVTVRQGFPGGPAAGAAYQATKEAEAEKAYQMPQIHHLVQSGDPADRAQAVEKMRQLGMTPPEMIKYLKYQEAPAARVSATRIQTLQRTNPEGAQKVRDALADQ